MAQPQPAEGIPDYNSFIKIEISDENLGRALIINLLFYIKYYNNNLFAKRFLKSKLHHFDSSLYQKIETILDINNPLTGEDMLREIKTNYNQTLKEIGSALIKSSDIRYSFSDLNRFCYDFNSVIYLFEGSQLFSKFISYEFDNPSVLRISFEKTENKLTYKYLLFHDINNTEPAVFNYNRIAKQEIQAFGEVLRDLSWSFLISEPTRMKIKQLKLIHPDIENRFSFIKELLNTPERIGTVSGLVTSNISFNYLENCKPYKTRIPEIIHKYVVNADSSDSSDSQEDSESIENIESKYAEPIKVIIPDLNKVEQVDLEIPDLDKICSICKENEKAIELTCRHKLCLPCRQQVLSDNTCGICKTELTQQDTIALINLANN